MAVEAFLKLDSVKGESKTKGYEDQIAVLAWSWGGTQSGTFHTQGGGGGAGKVNVNDLSMTKYIDKSSTVMYKSMCQGKHFKEALLTCRKAGGEKPVEFLKIKLTNILVASISVGGASGEETPTENVTLNFEKFEYIYTPQKEDGSADTKVDMKWDVGKNAES